MTGGNEGVALVVDDDAPLRALVRDTLERDGLAVLEAATGEEALAVADARAPAVVVLDVGLPGISGYEVCRLLRARADRPAIVFLSGYRCDPADRVAGLLLGADDYVTKPFAPDELVLRVRRLLPSPAPDDGLTPREREVLGLLASGLSQRAIAAQLVISPKTVGTHIEHVLAKLGAHSRAEAVAVAYRRELVSVADVA